MSARRLGLDGVLAALAVAIDHGKVSFGKSQIEVTTDTATAERIE